MAPARGDDLDDAHEAQPDGLQQPQQVKGPHLQQRERGGRLLAERDPRRPGTLFIAVVRFHGIDVIIQHSGLCGASGRGKRLVECFINVPQAVGPIHAI